MYFIFFSYCVGWWAMHHDALGAEPYGPRLFSHSKAMRPFSQAGSGWASRGFCAARPAVSVTGTHGRP